MALNPSDFRPARPDDPTRDGVPANAHASLIESIHRPSLEHQSPQPEQRDVALLDYFITVLEDRTGRQLDAVLHHHDFQALEALWRGLAFLVGQTDFRARVPIELLDVSKEALRQDFELRASAISVSTSSGPSI
jgi:type VI secretion system protein ImpC